MAALFKYASLFLILILTACGHSVTQEEGNPATPSIVGSCSNGPTSAQTQIFLENPKSSSGNSSLPYTSSLTSYISSATLEDLDGSCLLKNDHYKVTSDTLYSTKVAAVASTMNYIPSDPQFQQIMSYYHSNRLRRSIASMGADLSSLGMVSIDAHCNYNRNAYFSPSSNQLCFGYVNVGSSKKVWAADDADVIIHETGHSINQTLASTEIMNSTEEAGAMDEAYADYWALTHNNNSKMGEWFLGAIESVLFATGIVRDASENHHYPSDSIYEVHDDGRIWLESLWQIRSSIGTSSADRLVMNSLRLLPATARFEQGVQAVQDAAVLLNLPPANQAQINNIFQTRGLIRPGGADSPAGLRLSTIGGGNKQVYIMDDHTLTADVGGNCNGQLDEGETALIMVNLENTGAAMGVVSSILTSSESTSLIEVVTGGNIGEYFRFDSGTDFATILQDPSVYNQDAAIAAGFLVKAKAGSNGVRNFSMQLKPIGGAPINIPFSITIGTAATASSCSSAALWP